MCLCLWRGKMRMQIFDDQVEHKYFLELLKKGSKQEHISIHAYCLLPNHFHLLLSPTYEGSLSRILSSSVRFNIANSIDRSVIYHVHHNDIFPDHCCLL
jgi:REP element-mobilizing transposase RayT